MLLLVLATKALLLLIVNFHREELLVWANAVKGSQLPILKRLHIFLPLGLNDLLPPLLGLALGVDGCARLKYLVDDGLVGQCRRIRATIAVVFLILYYFPHLKIQGILERFVVSFIFLFVHLLHLYIRQY